MMKFLKGMPCELLSQKKTCTVKLEQRCGNSANLMKKDICRVLLVPQRDAGHDF